MSCSVLLKANKIRHVYLTNWNHTCPTLAGFGLAGSSRFSSGSRCLMGDMENSRRSSVPTAITRSRRFSFETILLGPVEDRWTNRMIQAELENSKWMLKGAEKSYLRNHAVAAVHYGRGAGNACTGIQDPQILTRPIPFFKFVIPRALGSEKVVIVTEMPSWPISYLFSWSKSTWKCCGKHSPTSPNGSSSFKESSHTTIPTQ